MTDAKPSEKGMDIALIIIVISAVIIAVIILINSKKGIDGVLEGIGFKDTKEEKATDEELRGQILISQNAPWWKPPYYKTGNAGTKLLTRKFAEELAKDIYDSVGHLTDTPTQASGAFKRVQFKSQISFLAEVFNSLYKRDLAGYLIEHFDTIEQKKVLNDIFGYVNKLQTGLVTK